MNVSKNPRKTESLKYLCNEWPKDHTLKILFTLTSFFLISCATKNSESFLNGSESQEIVSFPKDSCEKNKINCDTSKKSFPVMCSASSYNSQLLSSLALVQGWGNSLCEAEKNLLDSACKNGLDPARLDLISCVPDPSEGECHNIMLDTNPCPDAGPRTSCTSKKYDGIDLQTIHSLKGWGKNRCEALKNLKVNACRNNLIPGKMWNIECEDDHTDNECPFISMNCPLEFTSIPHICKVTKIDGKEIGEPVMAYGSSLCEAKMTISEIICIMSDSRNKWKPSLPTSMECIPQ
ncbi:MAG: hypothetical protein HQK54_02310 [Oligoflexales bacterium]|nr:hypothetical protein [Oligoflexales bacterium]